MGRGRRSVPVVKPAASDSDNEAFVAPASASDDDEDWAREPKAKPKRKSWGKKAKRASAAAASSVEPQAKAPLDGILDTLSVDVLSHVFASLEPQDLLSIARASKAAHAIVMDAENGPRFFAASFQPLFDAEDELPQPPKGLSLPQYAALVWPQHNCTVRCMQMATLITQSCGAAGRYTTSQARWLWRKTFCHECVKAECARCSPPRELTKQTGLRQARRVLRQLRARRVDQGGGPRRRHARTPNHARRVGAIVATQRRHGGQALPALGGRDVGRQARGDRSARADRGEQDHGRSRQGRHRAEQRGPPCAWLEPLAQSTEPRRSRPTWTTGTRRFATPPPGARDSSRRARSRRASRPVRPFSTSARAIASCTDLWQDRAPPRRRPRL